MEYEQLIRLIGIRIREKREGMGLTQEELAKRVDDKKTRGGISTLEKGMFINPTIKSICAVAKALGVDVWELMVPDESIEKNVNYPEALQKFIDSSEIEIREEEVNLLKHIKIKGNPPQVKEIYLLFWLLQRGLSKEELGIFFDE